MQTPLEFGWFLPTSGDTTCYGDRTSSSSPRRRCSTGVARRREGRLRVHADPRRATVLGRLDDAARWDGARPKMRMLIAARPSYINPVLLAKMIATFDQLSGAASPST